MERVYSTRINWENEPSINTPLNALNLNKIDYAVYNLDERVVNFDTTKANQSDMLSTLKNVSYNSESGIFTFEKWNGTTITADINIEKIPVSFALSNTGILKMTTTDGTEYTANIASLIKKYTFVDSTTIDFTDTVDSNGNHTIKADIVNGSITGTKLEPNYLANCTAQATSASASAQSALTSAQSASASAQQAMSATPEGYENLVALVGNSTLETTAQTITSAINELKNAEVEIDFDQTPTNGSQNAVTSNGIYNAIKTSADELKVHLATQNTFTLDTAEGGILVDKIKGNTVKNDDGLFTAGSMGFVDLSTLTWILYNGTYFTSGLNDYIKGSTSDSTVGNIIAENYDTKSYTVLASSTTGIAVRPSGMSNMVAVKSDSSPTGYLAYEVAEGKTPLKYALAIQTNNGKATTSEDYKAKEVFISLNSPLCEGDSLTAEAETHKYGYVDLGTLNWSYNTSSNFFYVTLSSCKDGTSNLICDKYAYVPNITTDKSIYVTSGNVLAVKDLSYDNADTFKNAVKGVKLVYELATQTTTAKTDEQKKALYSLESYDGKTIIDSADKYAKAEFTLRYGKSDTVAIALNAQNIAKRNEITLNSLIDTMYALSLESEV